MAVVTASAHRGDEMAILVVDDEPIALDHLAGVLRSAGHEVTVAVDGEEGLAICHRSRVDLIIADWIMPRMDGVALCRALKADAALRQSYVILLSARGEVPDKVQALDGGVDDYVVKPCADEEILARVRAGLRIRRLQDELIRMEWRLATRELAATLGHTINNPLQAIANYLEVLEHSTPSEATPCPSAILAEARHEVERMAGIIRRLVDLRDPQRIATALGTSMTDLGSDR